MTEPLLTLTVEAQRAPDGTPKLRVLRIDRAVDYGQISVSELRFLIEALLPAAGVPGLRHPLPAAPMRVGESGPEPADRGAQPHSLSID